MVCCRPTLFLFTCCLLSLFGIAQEVDTEQANPLYESVVLPDRTLLRRLEQAERLFESGRSSEAAQMIGSILENANFAFLMPEKSIEETDEKTQEEPIRTLRQTVNDHLIDRIRKLPKEAQESYAFQFEPTAKRLLENAIVAGSLDEIQQVAQKYFPTASGASATFLVGLTQFERGDYAAAFLTLDRLKRLHPAMPDSLNPLLEPMLEELQTKLRKVAEQPSLPISASSWLEQIGWRLPAGLPSQNPRTEATVPLLEQNWSVPLFTRLLQEREADTLSRMITNNSDVYIPASQPLVVGDLFITRTLDETIVINANTGKRLWIASEPAYRFPENAAVPPLFAGSPFRTTLRFFFWHNRIAHQLSSDGEKLFCIDGHDLLGMNLQPFGFPARMVGGGGAGGRGWEDLRYTPGSTLMARDLKTGQILWQAGKFPYVQKYFDAFFAQRSQTPNTPAGQVNIDEKIFTNDEKILKETWFLGAPLPLQGRLYVIGETEGIIQLFMLESQTGSLIAKQTFAHASSSITAEFVRRTYPLFPSASSGIVLCPSGNGLIAALDATTLSPIWCFSYAAAPTSNTVNRMMRNQPRSVSSINVDDHHIRQLFNDSGWQVPCIIVDRQRVLVAPPDQAALYCLDLLSGELLWKQTVSRLNALYVACVHDDKVFLVTPGNLMVIDMETGKDVTPYEDYRFPAAWKPAGVGVHSGNQYFIPFTEGHLAIVDLDDNKLNWLNASGVAVLPPVEEENASESGGSLESPERFMEYNPHSGYDYNRYKADIFSPDLIADDVFQKPIQFGNLVGIKGRFFSQSPTQISCFDQKEPLKRRAETLLQDDPNDPDGLLKQGRILKSEGKLAEAIEAFRASLKAKPTLEAADALRKNLLEAMRKDYAFWSYASRELESLAEFPEEWGAILYAQIEGILQSGQLDDLASMVEKIFALMQNRAVLIPVGSDHAAQLHRTLGYLIEQQIATGDHPTLKALWEGLAETFLQRLKIGEPMSATLAPAPFAEIQRWSMFVHIFRHTATAEKAKQSLREEYERHRLPTALNLLEKPSVIPEWSELSAPYVWKSGKVVVKDVSSLYDLSARSDSNRNEIDKIVADLVAIAKNSASTYSYADGTQRTVPFFGSPDSELSTFNYVIQPWSPDYFLCCNDSLGQEQWRLALPGTGSLEFDRLLPYTTELTCYIKGFRNFLLFVHGKSITAINVSSQPETTPKILWTKTLSSLLVSQQSSFGRSDDPRQYPTTNVSFPKSSVLISPHAVCCWDANCVYGLDPMTGQTLWVRKTSHENCSILGDADNLFLVFPDVRQVIAVDPASGGELASGPLPSGGAHIFGTNMICVKRHLSSGTFALSSCDLRDIHDKRKRALLISNSPDGQLPPPLPTTMLHDQLNDSTLMQTLGGDRFLSVATWTTKSLQIYDLLKKKKLLPEGNKLLQFVPQGKTGMMRCDVEFVDDHFLVLFTKDMNFQGDYQTADEENGKQIRRSYGMMPGVPSLGVGEGAIMLFDSEGNPCWSEPTKIKSWCRLLNVPDRLPVMLFATMITEREITDRKTVSETKTGIMGVDKRSGKLRFRTAISPKPAPLQSFRVSVDPLVQEIFFITPETLLRTIKATFTEDIPE